MVINTPGGLILLGLATDLLGRHTPLPRVTLPLVFRFLIGPMLTRPALRKTGEAQDHARTAPANE